MAPAAKKNTDFDEYYDANPAFYEDFRKRLQSELPNSIYTKNYLLKIRYYANKEAAIPGWIKLFLGLLFLGITGLSWKLYKTHQQLHTLQNTPIVSPRLLPIHNLLTQKEKEILHLNLNLHDETTI